MASNFGLAFGPTARPGHFVTSVNFFDDFVSLSSSNTVDAAIWDESSTNGTVTSTTDEPNGAVDIASTTATGDDAQMQLNGLPITHSHDRDWILEFRCKVSNLTSGAYFVGLIGTAGQDIGGGTITGAHMGFKTDQDASIDASSADGTTQSSTDTTIDFVADTYRVLTMKWHAHKRALKYYVDGVLRATHTDDDDNLPPDTDQLTIMMGAETTLITAATLTVDYVAYAGDRD